MGFQINTDGLADFGRSIADSLIARRKRQEMETFNESLVMLDKITHASPDEFEELMTQGKAFLQNRYKVEDPESLGITDHVDLAQSIIHYAGGKTGSPELGLRAQGHFSKIVGDIKDRDQQLKMMQNPEMLQYIQDLDPRGMVLNGMNMYISAGKYEDAYKLFQSSMEQAVGSQLGAFYSAEGSGASALGKTGTALLERDVRIWKEKTDYTTMQRREEIAWKNSLQIARENAKLVQEARISSLEGLLNVSQGFGSSITNATKAANEAQETMTELLKDNRDLSDFVNKKSQEGMPTYSRRNGEGAITPTDIALITLGNTTPTEPIEKTVMEAINTASVDFNIPQEEWGAIAAQVKDMYKDMSTETRQDLNRYVREAKRLKAAIKHGQRMTVGKETVDQRLAGALEGADELTRFQALGIEGMPAFLQVQDNPMLDPNLYNVEELQILIDGLSGEDVKHIQSGSVDPMNLGKKPPERPDIEQVSEVGPSPGTPQTYRKYLNVGLPLAFYNSSAGAKTREILNIEIDDFKKMDWKVITQNPRLTKTQKKARITTFINQFILGLKEEVKKEGGVPIPQELLNEIESYKTLDLPELEELK